MGTTEDVLVRVNIKFEVGMIPHFLSESVIEEHGLNVGSELDVLKCVSTLMMVIESQFMAVRALFDGLIIGPCKCATAVNTAVDCCSLDI